MPKSHIVQKLRDDLSARIDGIDRTLQLRATGASIHTFNNIRTSLQGILFEVDSNLALSVLGDFPAVMDALAKFIGAVSEAVRDGEITVGEIAEIQDLWVRTMSVCGVFLMALGRMAGFKDGIKGDTGPKN